MEKKRASKSKRDNENDTCWISNDEKYRWLNARRESKSSGTYSLWRKWIALVCVNCTRNWYKLPWSIVVVCTQHAILVSQLLAAGRKNMIVENLGSNPNRILSTLNRDYYNRPNKCILLKLHGLRAGPHHKDARSPPY